MSPSIATARTVDRDELLEFLRPVTAACSRPPVATGGRSSRR